MRNAEFVILFIFALVSSVVDLVQKSIARSHEGIYIKIVINFTLKVTSNRAFFIFYNIFCFCFFSLLLQ